MLVTNYRNKKIRININTPLKEEQKQETDQTNKDVEEDRKIIIQVILLNAIGVLNELTFSSFVNGILFPLFINRLVLSAL